MSADLLAEFGFNSHAVTQEVSKSQHPQSDRLHDLDNATSYKSRHVLVDTSGPSSSGLMHDLWHRDGENTGVLFDTATEYYDNEDWGEFESAQTAAHKDQPSIGVEFDGSDSIYARHIEDNTQSGPTEIGDLLHCLSTEDSEQKDSVGQVSQGQNEVEADSRSRQRGEPTIRSGAAFSSKEITDDWGEYVNALDESGLPPGQHAVGKVKLNKTDPGISTRSHEKILSNRVPESQNRPTNIPPPSILLQLFTPIFEEFHKEATRIKGATGGSLQLADFASRLTYTLKVATRTIVGRKLRWKRDSILSRSSKLGPARSGKSGGMKLNSISKSEGIKEEQAVIDTIEAWHQHATLFNSIILSAGGHPFAVAMDREKVSTEDPGQGALTASHACALCGLKRDERLPQVDESTEDSFEEWWIDHWGHTDCKRFWDENSGYLHQR